MANGDAALDIVIGDARTAAAEMESAPCQTACPDCPHLRKALRLSLLLLVGLYERRSARWTPGTAVAGLASLGVPTPVCVLVWLVGQSKGWW
jgi:hypothetical protein